MRGYVCCMGSINVDVTLRLDRVPDRHEKLPAREAAICGGGWLPTRLFGYPDRG